MRKSIFTHFLYLCFSIIAGAVVLVSAVHVFLSLETYQKDRKNELAKHTDDALRFTEIRLITGGSSEDIFSVCEDYFSILSEHYGLDFYLADGSGAVRACSEGGACTHKGKNIPREALSSIDNEGTYSMGNLSGYYDRTWLNMGYRIKYNGNEYYVFGRQSADSMRAYLRSLLVSYLIAAIIILALVYHVLYYSIRKIVKPISEMTIAAKRFGEGDFSQKINITEQNELGYLANSLNEMASSLEAIEENRKSFVSNVSHELKTPMTTIGGFVDGILDGTIPKSQHRYYLRIVSEEVDRLARLVRSMLNISKYESGEIQLQTESFDGAALIFRTVLLFEKRISDKKVEITGLDMPRFYLDADVDLAQQVIYNLTENAVKFVNEGGNIDFSAEERGDFVAIRIRNTGEGLKHNEISKVFDRFYKTDESRGKDKTGVGLGLSIVRSIIKLHKGTILVRSKPDEYTEFEFTLPAGSPPPKRSDSGSRDGE